jgi:flagellar protein FliL
MSADAQTPPADSPPSKGKKLLPFILALVVGLAAGAGGGLFVVGPAMAKGIAPVASANSKKPAAEHGEEADDEASADDESASDEESADEGESKKGGEGGEKASQVYTLDNLVLNPAESGGTRFLLLSITFETPNAALLEEMKTRDAELRDVVLVTLGAKTVEQLADMKSREALKAELVAATQKLFKKKKKAKMHIYFPQFVIQ